MVRETEGATPRFLLLSDDKYHAMIDHEHKVIFVHIPKTGGTSIERVFGHQQDIPSHIKHLAGHEIESLLGKDTCRSYFKFTFVRNPWERMVSWWHYFMQLTSNELKIYTLDDMLREAETHHFFQPHEFWLRDFTFDFIGRYERLQQDFSEISRQLNLKTELPWINQTYHGHYSRYYTEENRLRIQQKEATVINQFGYEFESE